MKHLRAPIVLALVAVLAACGSPTEDPATTATLKIDCVPDAEVVIDGIARGTAPLEISLAPGTHEVVLRHPRFESWSTTVDLASGVTEIVEGLTAKDPGDPETFALLAKAYDVEIEPFDMPEATRSASRGGGVVTLLWPKKDVRAEGLKSLGLEVSADYEGDGFLEFKHGRKILYRERFEPTSTVVVLPMPQAVRELVAKNDKVVWGVTFENKRHDVTATFTVVESPKLEKGIDRLVKRKQFTREPALTRALMVAQIFENYQLPTESLLMGLDIAASFPDSIQPYRGIVTALQRLDAKDSELYALTSQFVKGRGPNVPRGQASSTATRPLAVEVPGGGAVLGSLLPQRALPTEQLPLGFWTPDVGIVDSSTSGAVAGGPTPLGPGGAVQPGIRGSGAAPEAPAATSGSGAGGVAVDPQAPGRVSPNQTAADLEKRIAKLGAEQEKADKAAREADGIAKDLEKKAEDANVRLEAALAGRPLDPTATYFPDVRDAAMAAAQAAAEAAAARVQANALLTEALRLQQQQKEALVALQQARIGQSPTGPTAQHPEVPAQPAPGTRPEPRAGDGVEDPGATIRPEDDPRQQVAIVQAAMARVEASQQAAAEAQAALTAATAAYDAAIARGATNEELRELEAAALGAHEAWAQAKIAVDTAVGHLVGQLERFHLNPGDVPAPPEPLPEPPSR